MIDSHTHLSDDIFNNDRNDVIEKSINNGIDKFIEVLCSSNDWGKIDLFKNYKNFFLFSFSIHPHYTDELNEENIKKLELYIQNKQCIALGEVGIDLWYYPENLKNQLTLLETQINIAEKYNKKIIFHIRNGKNISAYKEFFLFIKGKIKNNSNIKGIVHSFSGSLDDAYKSVENGFILGIGGPITYPKNNDLREIIKKIGLKHIITETDCPYLPPQNIRGKRNEPYRVKEVINMLSDIFKMDSKEIEDKISQNFNLFTEP